MGMSPAHINVNVNKWNAGVAFMKGECVGGLLRRYFHESAKLKKITSDEHIWTTVSQNPRMQQFFQLIPQNFNMAEGQNWFNLYQQCGHDIKVLHIKPHQMFRRWHWYWEQEGKSKRTMSWKVTPPRLRDLFKKYGLWHPDNEKDFADLPTNVDEEKNECRTEGEVAQPPMEQDTPNEGSK